MDVSETHVKASRLLALVLRHKPEKVGISPGEYGWANVDKLVIGIAAKRPFTRETLEAIVVTDSKGRYSFNEDHPLIRANQGRSVYGDVEIKQTEPLRRSTMERSRGSSARLWVRGSFQCRHYAHLPSDEDVATKVGSRHDRSVVLKVDVCAMCKDGFEFSVKEWRLADKPRAATVFELAR